MRRLLIPATLLLLALSASACQYAWVGAPDSTQGGLVAVAALQVGQVDPPYSAGSFWCAEFVNAVAIADSYPGWPSFPADVGPAQVRDQLPITSHSAVPGELVYFDQSPSNDGGDYANHMGIVMFVNADGSFGSIEGNSSEYPHAVEVNVHPATGPDATGEITLGFSQP